MTFDINKCLVVDGFKRCQTRTGIPVRILCDDMEPPYCIAGNVIIDGKIKLPSAWDRNGKYITGQTLIHDLVNLHEPEQTRELWINLYPESADVHDYAHRTRKAADENARDGRIACVKVQVMFRPGDGLEEK